MTNKQSRDAIESKINLLLADRASLKHDQARANLMLEAETVADALKKVKIGNDTQKRAQRRGAHRQRAIEKTGEAQNNLRAEVFAAVEGLLIKRRKQLQMFDKAGAADLAKTMRREADGTPKCAGIEDMRSGGSGAEKTASVFDGVAKLCTPQ